MGNPEGCDLSCICEGRRSKGIRAGWKSDWLASQERLVDPVVAADGESYERAAIETWFAPHGAVSPATGAPLADANLCRTTRCAASCKSFQSISKVDKKGAAEPCDKARENGKH